MNLEEKINIKEQDLQAIYYFLMLNYTQLTEEEKLYWYNILKNIDPEFEEND